jgi:uncharacterized protein (DUF169 family)
MPKNLFQKLQLSSYPVAIKYITTLDEIPDNTMRPSMFGKKMALCQAFTMALQHGTTIAEVKFKKLAVKFI